MNSLHDKLPRLVLVACCICNFLNSSWIINQSEVIDKLWKNDSLVCVDSIVGHASDGDSRRRQLMLAGFFTMVGTCLDIK